MNPGDAGLEASHVPKFRVVVLVYAVVVQRDAPAAVPLPSLGRLGPGGAPVTNKFGRDIASRGGNSLWGLDVVECGVINVHGYVQPLYAACRTLRGFSLTALLKKSGGIYGLARPPTCTDWVCTRRPRP